jgi:hypothetical protein
MATKNIKKMGRPSLPKGEALDSIIPATRCRADERALYEKAAKSQHLTLSEWIRKTLNEAVK